MQRGLLADRQELIGLTRRISREPFNAIYDALRSRCSLILESSPISEAHWRTLWHQGRQGAAIQAARTTQGRILDLAIAHHIDRNQAFRDRAVEELLNLVRWRSWRDPSHPQVPADLCTAEAAVGVVVGLDWLWDDLQQADRQAVIKAVLDKAIAPYLKGVRDRAWWYECYHNWNAVINAGCGLAGLALSDEDPRAQEAYELSRAGLEHFFNAMGHEGGWDEGIGAWGYAMRYVLLLAEAARRTRADDWIFRRRGMDKTGSFPAYFTPNGRAAGFEVPPAVPLFGTLYLLSRQYDQRVTMWWLDTYAYHRDVSTSGWASAGLGLLLRSPRARTPKTIRMEPVKQFSQIGWAAIADAWPSPSMYVSVKAGDLSAHNSQRDMNNVQIHMNAERLIASPAYATQLDELPVLRSSQGEPIQASLHNTLTVAEMDHQIDARGAILQTRTGRAYRWVCCDAKDACGENVRFIRHVLMLLGARKRRGEIVLILDELTNGVPERVDVHWHCTAPVEMDEQTGCGVINGQRGTLHFALSSTVTGRCRLQKQRLNRHLYDWHVTLTAGVPDRALFASAFCRRRFRRAMRIDMKDDGAALIALPGWTVRFDRGPGYLVLGRISKGS